MKKRISERSRQLVAIIAATAIFSFLSVGYKFFSETPAQLVSTAFDCSANGLEDLNCNPVIEEGVVFEITGIVEPRSSVTQAP